MYCSQRFQYMSNCNQYTKVYQVSCSLSVIYYYIFGEENKAYCFTSFYLPWSLRGAQHQILENLNCMLYSDGWISNITLDVYIPSLLWNPRLCLIRKKVMCTKGWSERTNNEIYENKRLVAFGLFFHTQLRCYTIQKETILFWFCHSKILKLVMKVWNDWLTMNDLCTKLH